MNTLSNLITDFYIKKAYVPEDKREIYSYGFKLIIADIINFSMVMLMGAILGIFLESIVFLITLCGVRQFSGGFHARTFWLCRLSMITTFLCVTAASYLISKSVYCNIGFIGIVNGISVISIAALAPVKHPNKPLTEQQKKQNKIKAIITSLILSVISITSNRIEGVTISITLAAVVILMIIGIMVQKGGKKMFNWLSNLFMSSTADAAWEMAIYSVDVASGGGMHQLKEPVGLQEIAREYKASRTRA